jgi:hypothetical protein
MGSDRDAVCRDGDHGYLELSLFYPCSRTVTSHPGKYSLSGELITSEKRRDSVVTPGRFKLLLILNFSGKLTFLIKY